MDDVCRVKDQKLGLIVQVPLSANCLFPFYFHNATHSCISARLKEMAWLCHFIDQSSSYVKYGNEHIYKLKKALYELNKTPRAWYDCKNAYFQNEGFYKCPY